MKGELSQHFDMKYLREATVCLQLEIKRDRPNRILTFGQSIYIAVILKRFRMSDTKPASRPMDHSLRQIKSDDEEEGAGYATNTLPRSHWVPDVTHDWDEA